MRTKRIDMRVVDFVISVARKNTSTLQLKECYVIRDVYT